MTPSPGVDIQASGRENLGLRRAVLEARVVKLLECFGLSDAADRVRAARQDVLLTTHYLEKADQLAAMVAIVDRGEVVGAGTPDKLKRELRGDAIHIERAAPAHGVVNDVLRRVDGVREIRLDGRALRARADDGARAVPAVLAALESRGVEVSSVTVARPSVVDVYLKHTGRTFEEAERRPSSGRPCT